jgi:uncharacterized repeat protein (TIGR03803 family)
MPADGGERVNLAKQTSTGGIVLAIVFGLGAVIGQPVQAQTFTGLAYTGSIDPVAESPSGVVRDAAGNLYGATLQGGNTGGVCGQFGCGTVFKVDTTGTLTVLYKFTGGSDGQSHGGGLVLDTLGNLYGSSSAGTFKLDTSATLTLLHSGGPSSELVLDAAGNLYGVQQFGGFTGSPCGTSGCGIVFKIDTANTYSVLYSFIGQPDGAYPGAGLILDAAGNLYGTTKGGGAANHGTVFKLDTSSKETVLYSFTGAPDGDTPEAALTLAAGNLYGTTYSGGLLDCFESAQTTPPSNKKIYCGVVFKVDTTGMETVLHAFKGIPDGALPRASLVLDPAGNFYGTTSEGGSNGFFGCEIFPPVQSTGCGSIFKIDSTGTLSVLYSFSGGVDGAYPIADLALDGTGNLYGTSINTVFKLDPLGTPNFVLSVWDNTVNFPGNFTVNGVACPNICSEFFPKGTAVTITAIPAAGNTFAGWLAPCSGTGACNLTINSAQLVFANFALLPPDFSVSATPLTPAAVSAGGSSTSTLTVAAIGGFSNSVAFTCAVTPTPALAPTCSISPSSAAPGTPATLSVNTAAPTPLAMSSLGSGVFFPLCVSLIGLVAMRGGLRSDHKFVKRELTASWLIGTLFAGLVFQIACGGSSPKTGSKGTPQGAYTITVTGTYSTGSLVHTTPSLTLTVQ